MQYLDRIQAHAKAKNLDGAQHRRGGAISNKFGRGRATLKKQALAFASVLVIFVYLQSQTTLESARRALSINLGKGKCKWTPPKPMNVSSGDQSFLNTTTLLASYPGEFFFLFSLSTSTFILLACTNDMQIELLWGGPSDDLLVFFFNSS